jgi:copper resistance protein C
MFAGRHVFVRATVIGTLAFAAAASGASAHSYPQTMSPPANARLDFSPADIGITYDSDVNQTGTSLAVLDSTGAQVAVQPDATSGRQSSVQRTSDLAPGPYTVAWTSVSADDGHSAQGFLHLCGQRRTGGHH